METAFIAKDRLVNVLLVEDNIMDACLVLKYLKGTKVSNRVTVVRDGMEALDFLKKTGAYAGGKESCRPDLVLLDLTLPRLGGLEVLKEIKRDEDLRSIPVVVLTDSRAEEDILECYEAMANYYIIKPQDLLQFIEIMRYVEAVWLKPLSSDL